MKSTHSGFTLIELMLCVSLAAILLTIGLPCYEHYLVVSRRHQAEMDLMHLAMALEEYFYKNNSYADASLDNLSFLPFSNDYQFKIEDVDDNHYKVSAIPQNKQAKHDEACGILSIDELGQHFISGSEGSKSCWAEI